VALGKDVAAALYHTGHQGGGGHETHGVRLLQFAPRTASPRGRARQRPTFPAKTRRWGTWHLNVSKSTYKSGPAPKSQTRIYEKRQFGIQATVKTVYADGRSTV